MIKIRLDFLVEAMGVEPMSVILQTSSASCLVFEFTHMTPRKQSLSFEIAS